MKRLVCVDGEVEAIREEDIVDLREYLREYVLDQKLTDSSEGNFPQAIAFKIRDWGNFEGKALYLPFGYKYKVGMDELGAQILVILTC